MSILYPGSQQVPPMKYANKPSESQVLAAWDSGDWIAQEKKDGAWYQLEKTDDGEIYLFGRTLSKVTGEYTEKIANVPHIQKWANEYLPNGTTLIGEIYIPGGKSNDVTKIMGCTPENAYKRQFESDAYGGPIHYYVFDCIRYNGIDIDMLRTDNRYAFLAVDLDGIWNKYIELAKIYHKDFEKHLHDIFAVGGEGMVFKKKDCPYRAGMRTTASQMFKYKQHLDSIDLVCMELLDPIKEYTGKEIESWRYWELFSFYPDQTSGHGEYRSNGLWYGFREEAPGGFQIVPVTKPYYYGWKNAMRLGAYKNGKLVEVCRVASGFTDFHRQRMGDCPEDYLNHVVEIECMSLNKKDGTVRHPVFKQMRYDKNIEDCQWDEIFA